MYIQFIFYKSWIELLCLFSQPYVLSLKIIALKPLEKMRALFLFSQTFFCFALSNQPYKEERMVVTG
jgi:hypothetical protein